MNDDSHSTGPGWRRRLILASAILLMSCSGQQYADRTEEVVVAPESYGETALETESAEGFCSDFESPRLGEMLQTAFDRNLNLRSAWARIREAEAVADEADATLWPTVSAEISASRRRTEGFGGDIDGGAAGEGGETFEPEESNEFRASLAAAYEIDVWRRLAKQREAAGLDALATRADSESLAITIAARVHGRWFDALFHQQRVDVLERQLETSERFLELTLRRLSQGFATALDVSQQRQQAESIRGQLSQARAARDTSLNALAVLLGRDPGSLKVPDGATLPDLPPTPEPGIPADLVEQRPDVRAAYLRLKAADARTAVAARSRLPQLRLSASLFFQAEEVANLFDEIFWSIAGTASQSVFEGGRKQARLRAAESAAEAQLYSYARTLLTALNDVKNALIREASQEEFVESLEKQTESARTVLDLARDRYRRGAVSYLRVLTAIQSLQQTEISLLSARRQRLTHRVQLCRALGGNWAADIEPDTMEGE